jgi:hypothetical protein
MVWHDRLQLHAAAKRSGLKGANATTSPDQITKPLVPGDG